MVLLDAKRFPRALTRSNFHDHDVRSMHTGDGICSYHHLIRKYNEVL